MVTPGPHEPSDSLDQMYGDFRGEWGRAGEGAGRTTAGSPPPDGIVRLAFDSIAAADCDSLEPDDSPADGARERDNPNQDDAGA